MFSKIAALILGTVGYCSGAAFSYDFILDAPKYVIPPNMTGQVHIIDQSMLVVNVTAGSETVLRGYNAWTYSGAHHQWLVARCARAECADASCCLRILGY